MPSEDGLVTLKEIQEGRKKIEEGYLGLVRTPLLKNVTHMFPQVPQTVDLYLKLENMQTTGSFKLRGVANQMRILPEDVKNGDRKLVTMSAGNYGKAFAYALQKMNLSGLCLMSITAPQSRVELIKGYGIEVEQTPTPDLQATVDQYVREKQYIYLHSFDDFNLIAGYGRLGCEVEMYLNSHVNSTITQYHGKGFHFLHSFDDKTLIAGYGSSALEILDDGVSPDVVLVCCGGGGLVSGVASAFKLSGLKNCRIYAVEPQGSRTMYESFKKGSPVTMQVKSVAAGLSPPFAGTNTYRHCKKYVEDVILVSDNELLDCMNIFYHRGLVVEPSGCAAMAALIGGHVPDIAGKKVVVYVTGGNVTPSEMVSHLQ